LSEELILIISLQDGRKQALNAINKELQQVEKILIREQRAIEHLNSTLNHHKEVLETAEYAYRNLREYRDYLIKGIEEGKKWEHQI
jgi:hypothetical protein